MMLKHACMSVGFVCLYAACQHASGVLPGDAVLEGSDPPEAGPWGEPCGDGYVEIEPLSVSGEGRLVRFCAEPENLWYYADIEGDGERGTLQVTIPRHPADFRQYDYSACLWPLTGWSAAGPQPRGFSSAGTLQVSVTEDARTLKFSWYGSAYRAEHSGFYGQVNGGTYSEPSACVAKVDAREHLAQMPHRDRLHTQLVKYTLRDGTHPTWPHFDPVPSHDEQAPPEYQGKLMPPEFCFREVELDYALSDGRITKICRQLAPYNLYFHFDGVNSDAVLVVDVPYDYAPPLWILNATHFPVVWSGSGSGTSVDDVLWPSYVTHATNSYQTMAFDIPRGIELLYTAYCWWCQSSTEQPQPLVPLPGDQLAAGVPPGEVRCIVGHALMLGPGGGPACVDERSVEIMQRRGFELP